MEVITNLYQGHRKGKTKEVVERRERVARTGLSKVTEGCGRQTEMEAAGCNCDIIGGAAMTLLVKEQTDKISLPYLICLVCLSL